MNNNTEIIAPFSQPEQLYAAVDLGSNSFHMVIVRVVAGSVHIIGKVKQKVRLAAGLDENMVLDQLSLERGWNCLETFAERLQDIPLSNIKIVGTTTILYLPAAVASVCISINLVSQSPSFSTQVTLLASLNPALNCTTHKLSPPQGD